MLGHIMAWFYGGIGGILGQPNTGDFSRITIAPKVVGDITYCKTDFSIPQGKVACHWKIEGKKLNLGVTVPGNTKATLKVPGASGNIQKTVELGSGTFFFTFDW